MLARSRCLDAYLVLVGAISAAYGVQTATRSHGWGIGEWLINYSGGFVRRGLAGEFVLLVGRATRVPLPMLVLVLQVAAYAAFLWSVHRLVRGPFWTFGMTLVVLSPATLSFLVLDPPCGFKKEILLFAALGILLVLLLFDQQKLRDWQLSLALAVVLSALVLTHEALLLYFPYVLAAILLLRPGWRRSVRIAAFPAMAAAISAVAVATHPGTHSTAAAICRSVGGTMPTPGGGFDGGICSGGIEWLGQSFAGAHEITLASIRGLGYYRLYGLLVVPALAPMIWVLADFYRKHGLEHEVRIVAACSTVAMAASAFLFYTAQDWGRWIHMHAVCLMLLILLLSWRAAPLPRSAGLLGGVGAKARPAAVLALAVWALCWNLPAVPIYPSRTGYFGLVQYLRGYRAAHPRGSRKDLSNGPPWGNPLRSKDEIFRAS